MKKKLDKVLITAIIFILVFQIAKLIYVTQEKPVSYLDTVKIGEQEIILSGYGVESILSNEKSGAIIANPKEGWKITEVRYYQENNLNLKGGKKGNVTEIIHNNAFLGAEEKSQEIKLNSDVEYGKCYTHFYIYLQNLESGLKSKEVVTIFPYDELIIDWGKMIDGQTQFIFNLDYLEGDNLKNDDWIMVYKKEPELNSVAEFSSKEEFISDARMYCLTDNFDDKLAYEESEDKITIKIKKDCGLRSVSVENGGEGTDIKLIKHNV